jgi:endonuclease/exonuclease/phosphatase (EEP) superfamily protein YafD
MDRERLDFLCLQEAQGYTAALRGLAPDYVLISPGPGHETAILVRSTAYVDERDRVPMARDTWLTTLGNEATIRTMVICRLDGWLTVTSLHLPPSVYWRHGRPHGPTARVRVYRQIIRRLSRWVAYREGSLLVAADWNEPADTSGRWSPRWLANVTGSRIATNGGIDYVLSRGCHVSNMRPVSDRGGSDHRAHIFTIRPPIDTRY